MRLPTRLRRFADLARTRVGWAELLYAAPNKARPLCYFLKTSCDEWSLLERPDAGELTGGAFPHREGSRRPANST